MEMFHEDFLDNRNDWCVVDNQDTMFRIENGEAILEHRCNSGDIVLTNAIKQLPIDGNIYEARIRCVMAPTNSCYGLAWGDSDINSFLVFYIVNDGNEIALANLINGEYTNRKSWSCHPYPINIRENNTLKISRLSGLIRISINETIIQDTDHYPHIPGDRIGFIVGPTVKLKIQYIQVRKGTIPEKLNRETELEDNPEEISYPDLHFLSNGTVTNDYEEWQEDYRTGGFASDDDYWIYGRDDD